MIAILLEQLFDNLRLEVEPFATCQVASGWRLKMSPLEWLTLHFVLEGQGELEVSGGGRHVLHSHHLAMVPHRRAHVLRTGQEFAGEVTTDRPHGTDASGLLRFVAGPDDDRAMLVACGRVHAVYGGQLDLFGMLDRPVVLDFSDSAQMAVAFQRLLTESHATSPGSRAMMAALMNECLVLVFRRLCDSAECRLPWLVALDDPRMATVLERVLERPGDPHSLESLADLARMSRSAFAADFAASFGQTPMAFVRSVRLRRAAEILRSTDLTVTTVAHRVGYASRSHFSHAFTDEFDLPPTQFRSGTPT